MESIPYLITKDGNRITIILLQEIPQNDSTLRNTKLDHQPKSTVSSAVI